MAGDPANGRATISARSAVASALASLAFVGAVQVGRTVLVQFDDPSAGAIATAWAVPLAGSEVISGSAVPTDGSRVVVGPEASTSVVFVDAVTGKIISDVGFSHRPVP